MYSPRFDFARSLKKWLGFENGKAQFSNNPTRLQQLQCNLEDLITYVIK